MTGNSPNPYQYTGREDDGTGLYYYRARYYSAILQRFISEDPIGPVGGINLYRYASDNPVALSDAMGLEGGVAAAGAATKAAVDAFLAWLEEKAAEEAATASLEAALAGGVETGSAGGPIGALVGTIVVAGTYDVVQGYKLCQAYGICGTGGSPSPQPAASNSASGSGQPGPNPNGNTQSTAGRKDRYKEPTSPIDCWNQFARDLQDCANAYPPGPARLRCYEAARHMKDLCLGKVKPIQ